MKAVLLDTGVLLRERHVTDVKHALAVRAIEGLVKAGWSVRVAPQCLQEYWAVATRPAEARGGLGLTPERAAMDIEQILSVHNLLTEPPTCLMSGETLLLATRSAVARFGTPA
jgi:hypothetical protein